MEAYDDLQLQYYSRIDNHVHSESGTLSAFNDKLKYNGYIPSSNYLSYVYSSVITSLRPFMDQLISFVDGVVLKGDHSFKIIDHLAKINGVSTFSCLYTVLNEYEEIRLQVLAHSKSMEILAPQFLEMMETYRKLGMKEPELFYTDNIVGDEGFLKEVIPIPKATRTGRNESSLRDEKYASLEPIELPSNVKIEVL